MRTHYSSEVKPEDEGKTIVVAGWTHEIRDMGKLKFLILRDREGFIQITAKVGVTTEEVLGKMNGISRESVVKVKGLIKKAPKAPNGVEINPLEIEVISLAQSPLPMDPSGKVESDIDTRLNSRFMDVRKPEVAAIFKIRSNVVRAARKYLDQKGFIEIHSPKIIASASEGGTNLFPISYFDKEAYLAQSPQLYKQMMMSTGLDKVYETPFYFRAEEHDTRRHLNEITAVDVELAFIKDENDVMNILEGVVLEMIKAAAESKKELEIMKKTVTVPEKALKITYDEAVEILAANGKKIPENEDIDTEGEKLLGEIIKKERNSELYFIKDYPLKARPFYTMPMGENRTKSFDLEYKGVEVSSGSQRVHDYTMLINRMKALKLNPDSFSFYLDAFKFGMPPHGGFGLGIDRMMMQILELPIREVVLFPRDRHRLTP
jgi:nondiscriminating aspartyl-tRNA synthetase